MTLPMRVFTFGLVLLDLGISLLTLDTTHNPIVALGVAACVGWFLSMVLALVMIGTDI